MCRSIDLVERMFLEDVSVACRFLCWNRTSRPTCCLWGSRWPFLFAHLAKVWHQWRWFPGYGRDAQLVIKLSAGDGLGGTDSSANTGRLRWNRIRRSEVQASQCLSELQPFVYYCLVDIVKLRWDQSFMCTCLLYPSCRLCFMGCVWCCRKCDVKDVPLQPGSGLSPCLIVFIIHAQHIMTELTARSIDYQRHVKEQLLVGRSEQDLPRPGHQ